MLSERIILGLVLAFGSRWINLRDHGCTWWRMHLNFLKPLRRIRVLVWLIGSGLPWDYLFEIRAFIPYEHFCVLNMIKLMESLDYLGYAYIGPHRPAFVFVSTSQDKRKYNMFLIWYNMKKVWSSLRCRCFDSQNCKICKPPFLPSFINPISWRYHNLFLLTLYISRRHGERWQDIDRTW